VKDGMWFPHIEYFGSHRCSNLDHVLRNVK